MNITMISFVLIMCGLLFFLEVMDDLKDDTEDYRETLRKMQEENKKKGNK